MLRVIILEEIFFTRTNLAVEKYREFFVRNQIVAGKGLS